MKKVLVIHGPNLNMTGIRKKEVYGEDTLEDINSEVRAYADLRGIKTVFVQFNSEGDIITAIQESRNLYDGAIINPGAYAHYSYAIRDAIESVQDFIPFVEVHMSDIHAREDFRDKSVISDVCVKQICGHGKDSYKMGIDLLTEIL